MAIHFDFIPKYPGNASNISTENLERYVAGFGEQEHRELATLICGRLHEKNISLDKLVELYKEDSRKKGGSLREPDSNLLAKFRLASGKGVVAKKMQPFLFSLLEINEDAVKEAENARQKRVAMSTALRTDYEARYLSDNLPLLLRHSGTILEYREFSAITFRSVGYSVAWLGGAYICLGELLSNYKEGKGVAAKGCPRCGGDVYNQWVCGSALSGTRHTSGVCIGCHEKVRDAVPCEEKASERALPHTSSFFKLDRRYELPQKHVPSTYATDVSSPWNIFNLVEFLKKLQ